jgi:hypothetical protein
MSSIVGFNFQKISIERKKETVGKLNIVNNISVKDVLETKFSIAAASQKGLQFKFMFQSDYQENVASISLEGQLIYMTSEAEAKKVLDQWKKEKKIESKLMTVILNHILAKCNIQALMLARDVNLPPPFPLPKVKSQ